MSWRRATLVALLHVLVFCQQLGCAVSAKTVDDGGRQKNTPLEKEEWEPLHYKLYARVPSEPLGYDKTLEVVKQLNEIYAGHPETQTNGRCWRVALLLKSARREPDDCNREWLENLQELVDYNRAYPLNVLPFVRHNQAGMREYCEQNAHQILKQRVDDLGQQEHDDMDHLVQRALRGRSLSRAHVNHLWAHPDLLINGIVEFLHDKIEIAQGARGATNNNQGENNKPTGRHLRRKEDLKLDFDHYVIRMCDLWTHATKPLIGLRDYGLHVHLEDHEIQWLRYNDVCDLIYRDKKSISKKVHSRLTNKVIGDRVTRIRHSLAGGWQKMTKGCVSEPKTKE